MEAVGLQYVIGLDIVERYTIGGLLPNVISRKGSWEANPDAKGIQLCARVAKARRNPISGLRAEVDFNDILTNNSSFVPPSGSQIFSARQVHMASSLLDSTALCALSRK